MTEPSRGTVVRVRGLGRQGRVVLTGLVIAVGATLVTGLAAPAGVEQWLRRAPSTVGEADRLEVVYRGRSYTPAQIDVLQAQTGRPVVVVEDPNSYAKGRAHAFDTAIEADRWVYLNLPRRPS